MNILKSTETPLFMGVSVDFSSVEAIAQTHLPQNRAVFECFSYCEVEIYALSKKNPPIPPIERCCLLIDNKLLIVSLLKILQ